MKAPEGFKEWKGFRIPPPPPEMKIEPKPAPAPLPVAPDEEEFLVVVIEGGI